ncbi:hypothetical protein NQZ68_002504 [Dissostichus eleginoides]|nr:hypothetical protein NQZ68_002504 [Dissostichus eleginoides]
MYLMMTSQKWVWLQPSRGSPPTPDSSQGAQPAARDARCRVLRLGSSEPVWAPRRPPPSILLFRGGNAATPSPPPEHLLCPVHPPVRETQPSSSTGAPVFKSGNFWLFALDLYFGSFPHLLVDLPVG